MNQVIRKIYLYKTWIILVFMAFLPFMLSSAYSQHIANLALLFAMMSLSLNLLTGCTGLFSAGHMAFYGIGAYTSAILTVRLGTSVWVGILAAGIVAALFSLALGLPTARLHGLYLAVATLAFAEMSYQVLLNWTALTQGSRGIMGIPAPQIGDFIFDTYQEYYYLIFAALIIMVGLCHNLLKSRVGRALFAIKGNQIAASAMGINTTQYKVMIFMCSTFFAGIAGALYAHEVQYISPDSFKAAESASILAMMVVGGIGNLQGVILGGVILTVIPEMLREFGDIRLVLYGAAIVLIIVLAPRGIGGLLESLNHMIRRKLKMPEGKHDADHISQEEM